MGKSIAEISEESLKLISFFNDRQPGEEISYTEIEQGSGVRMDTRGKAFMRTALKRLGREYATHKGRGIELASPKNGLAIIANKVIKIDNAVKRGERTTRNIQRAFINVMDERDKRAVLFLVAGFGAIRLAAEQARVAFSNKKQALPEPKIVLPQI